MHRRLVWVALERELAVDQMDLHRHGSGERHRRDRLVEIGTKMWKLWRLLRSSTVSQYVPGLSDVTGAPSSVRLIVKPGPTVP